MLARWTNIIHSPKKINTWKLQPLPHSKYVLWFNFILGFIFIFFCFKLIIIYYHTQRQKEIKMKPRVKLNHNICTPGSLKGARGGK